MTDSTSPYVTASAASTRSEADIRNAGLEDLYAAKIIAQESYTRALQAAQRLSSTDDQSERVKLDIIRKTKWIEFSACEDAYEEALKAHCVARKVVKNAG
jgi:hypothetical protein